jgi:exodeoxyribonuclease VII small subunit
MVKKEISDINQLTYEQAFAKLEELVGRLESGQIDLDEAVNLFERGQALAQRCQQLLENADLKVRTLAGGKKSRKE